MNITVTCKSGTWTAIAEVDGKEIAKGTSKAKDADGRDAAIAALNKKLKS